ncbi:MAG: isochorismate synthase [Dehalococcoidia bacterium]|nr:isochorismate synthase [Dehalococcoidia bacterium]
MTDDSVSDLIARLAALPRIDGFRAVSLTSDLDPRALLADPIAHGVTASYERPDQGLALVGVGVARRIEVPAGRGPSAVREDVRALFETPVEGDAPGLRPRLLGGFRFNPGAEVSEPWSAFGAGWLVLPRVLLVLDGESTGAILAPGEDPAFAASLVQSALRPVTAPASGPLRVERPMDRALYLKSVAAIASEVREGVYEKAVLASTQMLRGDGPVAIGAALERLRQNYPGCHVFTMSSDGYTFLGASPELLVRLSDGEVQALGLAGSLKRGETPEEDERLGEQLLTSAKDRIEHETVVRAIRERLAPATEQLHAPNAPRLRKLRNIQHLSTEISGRVRPGVDVLDLVQRVHPTPAVCGWPTAVAREVIAAHEEFDRGWYAGPVGWVDATGDGEFAVSLRSAVVQDDHAWLFAGNGIMGDSEPESELAEVQWKYRPLVEALGPSASSDS